jgi:hypothetical protein
MYVAPGVPAALDHPDRRRSGRRHRTRSRDGDAAAVVSTHRLLRQAPNSDRSDIRFSAFYPRQTPLWQSQTDAVMESAAKRSALRKNRRLTSVERTPQGPCHHVLETKKQRGSNNRPVRRSPTFLLDQRPLVPQNSAPYDPGLTKELVIKQLFTWYPEWAIATMGLLLSSVTFAQLPAPPAQAPVEAQVERVIVTGSNIPTAEETGPNPVDTYRPADLEKLGIRNSTDLTTFLPQEAGGTTNPEHRQWRGRHCPIQPARLAGERNPRAC